MNIEQYNFSSNQYIQEEFPKTQIYLHHTAGGPDALNVFKGWEQNSERIATCVAISNNGKIIQGFSSKFWAYHLGLKEDTFRRNNVPYISLDKYSIGIEICNWGQLTLKNGKFYNYVNREIPSSEVCELQTPFKGHKYYHNYTDAQIESTKDLLLSWKERYNIPLTYNEDVWDITPRALKNQKGVFTHNSVRTDKVDVYPHPKLIEIWKSL
jgi:N-acetyl-anhydromuramyl-L-alanine amidase AmpD